MKVYLRDGDRKKARYKVTSDGDRKLASSCTISKVQTFASKKWLST